MSYTDIFFIPFCLTLLDMYLFPCVQSWLKPGGQLLISDYCCGEKPWTPAFEAYVKQRGYVLYTPAQYGKVNIPTYVIVCERTTRTHGEFTSSVLFTNTICDQRTDTQSIAPSLSLWKTVKLSVWFYFSKMVKWFLCFSTL